VCSAVSSASAGDARQPARARGTLLDSVTREQWQDRAHETNSRDCLRLPTGPCAGPRLGHPLAVSSPVGLPADGEVRIEGVRLSGHLVRAESGQEVAWVTDEPQQAPGRVWLELSHARTQTGLVPVLLADEPPLEWGDDQQDPSGADSVRPEEVFTAL
jgi:hypothetical protein